MLINEKNANVTIGKSQVEENYPDILGKKR